MDIGTKQNENATQNAGLSSYSHVYLLITLVSDDLLKRFHNFTNDSVMFHFAHFVKLHAYLNALNENLNPTSCSEIHI